MGPPGATEDLPERTWMCWPSSGEVWESDLPDVQDAIARVALAISAYEPVTMLARPAEADAVRELLGDDVEVVEAPVDDLWARDTLPALLVRDAAAGGGGELAAGRVRFNGWGDKQVHRGDARLAAVVARHLDIELIDSGVVGEGGGFEIDGAGTVLAAESSWVNDNRNPSLTKAQIEERLLGLLGADRLIWVDGLAGHDITDGHIDTLARFASPVHDPGRSACVPRRRHRPMGRRWRPGRRSSLPPPTPPMATPTRSSRSSNPPSRGGVAAASCPPT